MTAVRNTEFTNAFAPNMRLRCEHGILLTSTSKSPTSVTTTRNRKARQMKFDLVGLHFPGGPSAPASGPAHAPARLAARGFTFTTVGSSGR